MGKGGAPWGTPLLPCAGGGYGYQQLTEEARELEAHAKGEDVEAAALSLGRLTGLCRRVRAGAAVRPG